jgi:hypothetical protein
MFKGLGMALAMLGAIGQRRSTASSYVPPQSTASKEEHLDRAKAKRERKAEKLRALADRGHVNG